MRLQFWTSDMHMILLNPMSMFVFVQETRFTSLSTRCAVESFAMHSPNHNLELAKQELISSSTPANVMAACQEDAPLQMPSSERKKSSETSKSAAVLEKDRMQLGNPWIFDWNENKAMEFCPWGDGSDPKTERRHELCSYMRQVGSRCIGLLLASLQYWKLHVYCCSYKTAVPVNNTTQILLHGTRDSCK